MRTIYCIGGCKGGVGKSLVSMAVLDILQQVEASPLLVETDTSNPDVGKAYQGHIPTELVDLDHADGWIALVNLCDQHGDKTVVINTAARNNLGLARYGQTLGATLQELQRHLVTLWVINRNRDSLELLKEYRESMACGQIHVVRNGFFGAEEAFDLYNDSNLRRTIESEGGQSLVFPALASRVADDLYRNRLTIAAAMSALPLGNRAELNRWRTAVRQMFGGLVHD